MMLARFSEFVFRLERQYAIVAAFPFLLLLVHYPCFSPISQRLALATRRNSAPPSTGSPVGGVVVFCPGHSSPDLGILHGSNCMASQSPTKPAKGLRKASSWLVFFTTCPVSSFLGKRNCPHPFRSICMAARDVLTLGGGGPLSL